MDQQWTWPELLYEILRQFWEMVLQHSYKLENWDSKNWNELPNGPKDWSKNQGLPIP